MPEMNFMTAGTYINEYITKMGQCEEKIANITAESVIDRASKRKIDHSVENDILKLLKDLPDAVKVRVLIKVVKILATNISHPNMKTSSSQQRRPSSSNGLFSGLV